MGRDQRIMYGPYVTALCNMPTATIERESAQESSRTDLSELAMLIASELMTVLEHVVAFQVD